MKKKFAEVIYIIDIEDFAKHECSGGFGIVEMLGRSNFLALVGNKTDSQNNEYAFQHYSPQKVVIWDDSQTCPVIELEFKSVIQAMKLTKDYIIAAVEGKLHVYSFSNEPELLKIMNCSPSMNQGMRFLVTLPFRISFRRYLR